MASIDQVANQFHELILEALRKDFNSPGKDKNGQPVLADAADNDVFGPRRLSAGQIAIVACREKAPAAYCKMITSLMPKEFKVSATEDLTAMMEELNRARRAKLIPAVARIGVPEPVEMPEADESSQKH